jgi:hypothetical protein
MSNNDFAAEETIDPVVADRRNLYKVEQWSKDGKRVVRMVYASNRIERARALFDVQGRRRPGGRYTIRQGIRVLRQWPES